MLLARQIGRVKARGVGRLLADSVYRRDYPTVQAGLIVIGALVVAVNLVTDFLYVMLDPRVRLR